MTITALILAAGKGSRLADDSPLPKPLRRVCGLALIERAILCAAKAGIKRAVVVTGYRREKIEAFLSSRDWPVIIETIDNPEWQKSNGVSVLRAKELIHENFILMMADHVFAPAILNNLCRENLDGLGAKLAVDYKIGTIFDIADATKVETGDGMVLGIGKSIERYNAVDTGLFLMTPEIFSALEERYARDGDCSLSDGIAILAERGRMGAFDIGGDYWQDVDTPESLKHAETVLLTSCRKPTDGRVSRNFNRYISIFISKHLLKTFVTANQVTFFTTLVGLLSGWLAAQGSYASFLAGAFLFKLTSILDGVDGEMSKMRLTDSKMGQWLDTISDNLTYIVFIIGTVVGVNRRPDLGAPPLLANTALIGTGLLMGTMFTILATATDSGSLLAIQKDFVAVPKRGFFQKLWGRIYFVIKRDFFATFFLVLAVFNLPQVILFFIALATNIAWPAILKSRIAGRKR